MLRALYTSATGVKAQEMLIDNTANNLANVNTTGFKRSRMDFADLVYTTYRAPGRQSRMTRSLQPDCRSVTVFALLQQTSTLVQAVRKPHRSAGHGH